MNTYTDGNELKIEVRHLENSQICDLMNSTHGSKKKRIGEVRRSIKIFELK